MLRPLVALACFAVAAPIAAQTHTGRLASDDETLTSGEYRDQYTVDARPGDVIEAVLTSDAFDPYVIVISPSEAQEDNDDCTQGDTSRSCVTMVADVAGTYRVLVTSFEPGETGPYRLALTTAGSTRPAHSDASFGTGETGTLGPDDETLTSGEFVDRIPLTLAAGERVRVVLSSSDLDPYLIVKAPDGSQEDNDDCEGDLTRSCLEIVADQAGTWEILATSYLPKATGSYALAFERGGHSRAPDGSRREAGTLGAGDVTLESGEYVDRYTIRGTGGPLVADLSSTDFDPYLIVRLPDGEQVDNDDHEGSLQRSLLVVDTEPGAEYVVDVTSYAPGEIGAYRLSLQTDGPSGEIAADGVRRETGTLAAGDDRLEAGEYVDKYTFAGVPGQRLRLDLTSNAFDTYLVLDPPRGESVQDDDGGGRVGHSRIEADLTEPGTYTVFVTSYAADETGPYELAIDLSERFGTPVADAPDDGSTPSVRPVYSQRNSALTLDETIRGALDASDQRLSSGEFMEVHTFEGEAGEPVRVEMTSNAFDTYVIVEAPSGEQIENDDFEGSTDRSVVEFSMPTTGRYRVLATSYRPGETGPYEVRLSQADALRPDPLAYDKIVGLFVGISDYDRMSDLRYTAQDATTARDAMIEAGMAPDDSIILTDAQATDSNVRAAMQRLAARADDRTLFVLFFSGHGAQYDRAGFQRADPDGLDESLELFDTALLDDDLDALLTTMPAGRQLIVLDACYSGGFAKDVISRPGRMGLFSSEEDVLSSVATKFEAGGYLSRFFSEAVAEHRADTDHNGAVTALELSLYLDDRFAAEVRSEEGGLLGSREFQTEHQKLVVDRGSVGLYDTLFLFRP